jgi:hypothetical protein
MKPTKVFFQLGYTQIAPTGDLGFVVTFHRQQTESIYSLAATKFAMTFDEANKVAKQMRNTVGRY